MCQEYQPYLALKDVSCFRANGYAVVLFYYNHGLNFVSLCLGYGNHDEFCDYGLTEVLYEEAPPQGPTPYPLHVLF